MTRKKIIGIFILSTFVIGLSTFYWGYHPVDTELSAEDGWVLIEWESKNP